MDTIKTAGKTKNRDRGIVPIFVAVSLSFLFAITVSIYSLAKLARENTKEIDTMLSYRIYDTISSSLNEPIIVSKTMACDEFLKDFLKHESEMTEQEAVDIMERYLESVKSGLEYDSAFLVSEKTHRYYTYEGLNKIVDPEHDDHDIWYSLFLEKEKPYDLDVDIDEVNNRQWTVFVNTRIEDDTGRLIGVCGVGVQMTNLQDLFLTSEQEYGVKINLVNKDGLVQVDTEDINIENAWLDDEIISVNDTDEYVYRTTESGEFAVTKYVEYLGWYLVVRSAPTSISKEFVSIIMLNIVLFLIVMAVLTLTIFAILNTMGKKTKENERLLLHVVSSLASAIDAKDTYTNGHSNRVADYSKEIARRAGYDTKRQQDIYMMGLLHDVGKIGVPDAVINKPAKLTNEEYKIIKNHPVLGARILGNIEEMPSLQKGAKWHHERPDGNGYPDGLSGGDIPEEARIISVADAYDAMTSHRSYREPLPQSIVRKEIEKGLGTQFDPTFGKIMLEMIDEDPDYRMREG